MLRSNDTYRDIAHAKCLKIENLVAWVDGEASPSSNGLAYRWIPKGCLTAGLLLLFAGVISVMLRSIVYLFGDPSLRGRTNLAIIENKE